MSAAQRRRAPLGELLCSSGAISRDDLARALEEQRRTGKRLGRTLLDLGLIDEPTLIEIISRQLEVPVIDLTRARVDRELARKMGEVHARRLRALPVSRDPSGAVLVAMVDPSDITAIDELSRLMAAPIVPAVTREGDLLRAIDLVYGDRDALESYARRLGEELASAAARVGNDADDDSPDAPVARLVSTLIESAVRHHASDLHIEPTDSGVRIRERVDGRLREQRLEAPGIAAALAQRVKLMADLDIADRRLPQDGRLSVEVDGRVIDVRVATLPIADGESVSMRLLDRSAGIRNLDEIGIPAPLRATIERVLEEPHGLVLVTGPTGSGKTTTLYAALAELDTAERKIITVEDPVEYRLERANQVQVHPEIGLDFARVLRSALRNDPDVILVGEIRDEATMHMALRAAMTGHLVLSTLHTNDAPSAFTRLADMGAPGYLLAAALRAVVAQRLVRKLCARCVERRPVGELDRAWLSTFGVALPSGLEVGVPVGCNYCAHTGYDGRAGVFELITVTPPVRRALGAGNPAEAEQLAAAAPSYRPLAACAAELAVEGVTSIAEVRRLVTELSYEEADLA